MKKSLWKVLKVPVFIAVGLGLLYLTFRNIDLEKMWEYIQQAKPAWVILSLVLGYVAIISRGIRWQYLLEPIGYKVDTMRSIHSVAFGYFANLGVPRSGEVARCTMLNQTDDVPVDKLFGTVILERVIDTLMLAFLLGTAFLMNVDVVQSFFDSLGEARTEQDGESTTSFIWYLLAAMAIVGVLLLILWKRIIPKGIREKVEGFLKGILEGLKTISTLKKRNAFIFHTLLIWGSYVMMSYVCIYAFEQTSGLNFADGLFLMVAGGLGMLAPAQGGAGAYHYMVTLAFAAIGAAGHLGPDYVEKDASEELGGAFAWVLWSSQTIMIIVAGIIGYLALTLSMRKQQTDAEE